MYLMLRIDYFNFVNKSMFIKNFLEFIIHFLPITHFRKNSTKSKTDTHQFMHCFTNTQTEIYF